MILYRSPPTVDNPWCAAIEKSFRSTLVILSGVSRSTDKHGVFKKKKKKKVRSPRDSSAVVQLPGCQHFLESIASSISRIIKLPIVKRASVSTL